MVGCGAEGYLGCGYRNLPLAVAQGEVNVTDLGTPLKTTRKAFVT